MKSLENFQFFCQRVKLIRTENKLTQREMAKKLGISVPTWELVRSPILHFALCILHS